jgi:hypothetical protein
VVNNLNLFKGFLLIFASQHSFSKTTSPQPLPLEGGAFDYHLLTPILFWEKGLGDEAD